MNKEKISNLEYSILNFFLTKAFFVGITFNYMNKINKQDSWTIPLISIIIGLSISFLVAYIINYKEEYCIIKKINSLFKTKTKYIFMVSLIIIGLIYNILNQINLTNFIQTQFLDKTPTIIISILFISTSLYVLTKGIHTITKMSVIIFYISILLIIISIIGLIPKFEILNLKPYFQINGKNIIESISFYYTFNIAPILLLTIIPKDKIKNPKIYKDISLSYILSTFTMFMVSILTIGVFGYELTSIYKYPEFEVLKQISIIGISSRIESILVIQWIFDLFIYNVFIIYFVCNCIKRSIKQDLNLNLVYAVYCLIIIILVSFLINHNVFLETFTLNQGFNYIALFTIAILLILILKIKINKLRQEEK